MNLKTKQQFIYVCFFISTAVFSAAIAAPPSIGDWQLIWSDEFDSGSNKIAPDSSNWGYENGYVRNNEWQYYTNSLTNAYCQNGFLHIEAHKYPAGTYPSGSIPEQDGSISSASLKSYNKVMHKFGWLEMRAKIDTQWGSWPAFWTLGKNGQWPDNGECDIMEYYRNMLKFNIAWWKTGDAQWTPRWDGATVNLSSLPSGWSNEFHTWAMQWDTDEVKLYMDGVLYNTWDSSLDSGDSSIEGFQQKHYILLNQAIGGNAGGDASGVVYPTNYEIDYVRWYQVVDGSIPNMVDDTQAGITYTGSWGTWTGNPSYDGTEHFSTNVTARATFTFTGTKVQYFGTLRNDLGIANIYLDGSLIDTVDCYSPTAKYIQRLYDSPTLAYGTHTLAVEVTGNYNPSANDNDGEIIVDAFGYLTAEDTTAPAKPTNLQSSINTDSIDIDWDDNSEEDIRYYNIYRTDSPTAAYTQIAAGILASNYSDNTIVPNSRYYYVVTAEDYAENESGYSNSTTNLKFAGDIDLDSSVDLYDIAELGSLWLTAYDYYGLADVSNDWLLGGDMVLHLPLDTDANDASGYKFNGVVYGDTVWDPCGYIDGAVQFDGSGDYIEIPRYTGIVGTQSRTVAAWFKTGYNLSQIISWGGSQNGSKWVVQLDVLDRLQLDVGGGTATSSAMINDNLWHHIAIVLDNDGTPNLNEVQFYIDGQPAIANAADVPINTTAGEDVKIGVYSPNPKYFNGLLDDVRIYDRALSTQEIEILAQ